MNILNVKYAWDTNSADWLPSSRFEYTYNNYRNETSSTYSKWSSDLNSWVNDSKSILIYAEDDCKSIQEGYEWNQEYSDWILEEKRFYFNVTTISEVSNTNLWQFPTVYPNPTHGELMLKNQGSLTKIEVYNSLGSLVYERSINEGSEAISLLENPNGIYFFKFINQNYSFSFQKILIQK